MIFASSKPLYVAEFGYFLQSEIHNTQSPRKSCNQGPQASYIWAVSRDFQQCGILTSVDSD